MPLLRKIVFYIFAGLYLTICPLLILRLLGYTTNPQTHQLVKTGIIYASTNPPNATVYINNLKANEETPTIIRDLPPDNYIVRMELKGYLPWQNTIPIVERKATVLENILLIPEHWTVKTICELPIENIIALGDENTLLIWQAMTVKDLYYLQLNKESSRDTSIDSSPSEPISIFPEESIYSDAQILRFFTVEKSPFFILHILSAEKHKYLWVDVRDKQIHIEDISDLLPQEPLKLWWETNDEKIIYAFYNDHINRINIKAKAIYPHVATENIPTNKKDPLYIENLKTGIWNENNDLWLGFTSTKIGLWDNNLKSLQWIFEGGRDIAQVFWANNSNTIIFRDDTQVFLLDKKSFNNARLQKITTIHRPGSIYYSEKAGRLYYIDPKSKLLSAIQILRHKPILPKTIADTLKLKELEP